MVAPSTSGWRVTRALLVERDRSSYARTAPLSPSAWNGAPRVRLPGRSAQDAIARQSNDSGAIRSTQLPHAACDATAPDNSKTIPAYAHSLSLRNPGTTKVIAPGILKIPTIARMYTGYPRLVTTWVTNGPLTTPVRP